LKKSRTTNMERAKMLRDLALMIVKARGSWEETNICKLLAFSDGNVEISYHTPFQRLPEPSEIIKYWAARVGRQAEQAIRARCLV
jgi:hypothetical protein